MFAVAAKYFPSAAEVFVVEDVVLIESVTVVPSIRIFGTVASIPDVGNVTEVLPEVAKATV